LSHLNLPIYDALDFALGTIGNPSMNRGAPRWFHNVQKYGTRVVEY
jgi:hypothetical protein